MAHSNENLPSFDLTLDLDELHHQLLSALHAAVPTPLAVCYAGSRNLGGKLSGSLLSDGTTSPLAPLSLPEAERQARALLGHDRALVITFRHRDQVCGVGGVTTTGRATDALRLRQIAPLLGSLIASHARCSELARLAAQREAALAACEARPGPTAASNNEQRLSPREREIARLLVDGYAAINAAAVLDLSEHTVRTYIRRLYRKLDVKNRADLVRTLVLPAPLAQ